MDSINLNDLFLDDNYSIESLLVRAQDNKLNLNKLRDCLVQHQQDLNQTSLELFNNSYDRFYKLSYIISCLSEPIHHLIDPLKEFRNRLADLCQRHDGYIDEINNKLSSLEDTCKNKELARLLIGLIKRRDRLEAQMSNIDWTLKPAQRNNLSSRDLSQTDTIEYKIKYDLLERINVELYHLTSEVRAIQPTHDELTLIKKSLESNLDDRQNQLDQWFERSFLEAIESDDKPLINIIVQTYRQKDSIGQLDAVWRSKVVKPYLSLTLTNSQTSEQVGQIYTLLDQFVKHQLDLIQAEFVSSSFWRDVIESLDKLESIYSLNELDSFLKRYNETKAFLDKQNVYLSSDKDGWGLTHQEVESNTTLIMSKFNLKGYFNHRLSQIASSVESSLVKQPLSEISVTSRPDQSETPEEAILAQFRLKICMHIYVLVTKCWSPDIYVEALELSFVQLACRILNRFSDWLSKLRLSDFRITGPTATNNNHQTNFLAKQDAIMRLLIEDCDRLKAQVEDFTSKLSLPNDESLTKYRSDMMQESFKALDKGLSNVRSLQHLIER